MTKFHEPYVVSDTVTFGTPDLITSPVPRLFAFALQEGQARVFSFNNDEDGQQQLALLLRSETVVTVVNGYETIITDESLLTVRTGQNVFQDRYQKLGLS
jgi:hypothetical protein